MALSPPAILNTVTATLVPVEYLTRAASLFTNGTGAIFLCVCVCVLPISPSRHTNESM